MTKVRDGADKWARDGGDTEPGAGQLEGERRKGRGGVAAGPAQEREREERKRAAGKRGGSRPAGLRRKSEEVGQLAGLPGQKREEGERESFLSSFFKQFFTVFKLSLKHFKF